MGKQASRQGTRDWVLHCFCRFVVSSQLGSRLGPAEVSLQGDFETLETQLNLRCVFISPKIALQRRSATSWTAVTGSWGRIHSHLRPPARENG
jgi:hypothetical protein